MIVGNRKWAKRQSIKAKPLGLIFTKASQKFLKGFFVIVQKYSLPLPNNYQL
jgi:hypothetical protein